MKSLHTRLTFSLLAGLFLADVANAVPSPAWAPVTQIMQPGIAAMTCTSTGASTTEDVLALFDLRDPVGCAATPIGTAPFFWNIGLPRMLHRPNWTVGNLGEVFGVDVASAATVSAPADIYISALGIKQSWRAHATSALDTGSGGEVWRINGTTGAHTLVTALPNHKFTMNAAFTTFVGLGQVSHSKTHNTIYVSNFDDGKIYVIDVSGGGFGTQLCTFDHGQVQLSLPDNPNLLYTQPNRLVFGLEYNPVANSLFYALRNPLDQDEVWSLALNATGCPVGIPCLEFVSAPFAGASSATFPGSAAAQSLPGDIQFSPDGCRMLITHVSGGYGTQAVSLPSPSIPGLLASQPVLGRSAHTSVGYECKKTIPSACGNWNYVNYYRTGTIVTELPNSVAGDYGFGDLKSAPRGDSVVFVAETVRGAGLGLHYGLQISGLDDYTRAAGSGNFDIPLTSPSGLPATKFQLNDVDVLHIPACMCIRVPQSGIACPPLPGGNYTFNMQVTNNTAFTATGISPVACPPSYLPPGALTALPLPLTLPGGSLAPGATASVPVSLPGVPITGGTVCFCVQLTFTAPGAPACMEIACVNLPDCSPPCVTLAAANVQCISGAPGGYVFNLNFTNIQPVSVSSLTFSPCLPAQLPSGAITGTPSPGTATLGAPVPNGGSGSVPIALPGVPTTGATYCCNVTLNSAAGAPICTRKICLPLPACPDRCVTVTTSGILCPNAPGAPYTLTLNMTNIGVTTATAYSLNACNPLMLPPGAVSVSPAPGGFTPLTPPLAPGNSTSVNVSLPGLPCSGGPVCFCLTLFGYPQSPTGGSGPEVLTPLCNEMVCVNLPACPCPPCVELVASNIHCPEVPGGNYTLNLNVVNLSPTTAYWIGFTACPTNQLPPGASTVSPLPGGIIALSPPLATLGSANIPIQLPVPATAGTVCFCVNLLSETQSVICRGMVCVTLPVCGCVELISQSVTCLPNGTYQVSATVKNNSIFTGTPFPFDLATFSPSTGFSPPVVTPSPNPIASGGTGTVTAIYSGASGVKCVNIIFSNAARTRCCPVKVCFNLPPCEPTLNGRCLLRDQYTCEGPNTKILFYINNPAGVAQCFNWTISPVGVPGCVTMLASAFSPTSGTTALIGPGGSLGVCVNVNTSGLQPGNCAGFQVCVSQKGVGTQVQTCCRSLLRCPGLADPCIFIRDPKTVLSPGRTIGIPIIIKNPTTSVMNTSFVISDSSGSLVFRRFAQKPDSFITGSDAALNSVISDDNPYAFFLQPGQTTEVTVYAEYAGAYQPTKAVGGIIVGPPTCVGIPVFWGDGQVILGPISTTGATKFSDHIRAVSVSQGSDGLSLDIEHATNAGQLYRLQESNNLMQWEGDSVPAVSGAVVEPTGEFWGTGQAALSSPPRHLNRLKNFFRLIGL